MKSNIYWRAPFPWFGGKQHAVAPAWAAFGAVDSYIEPFAGSAAMLLGAPSPVRLSVLNDTDGYIVNFWRAVRAAPHEVAQHVDYPCAEIDHRARELWLVNNRPALVDRLIEDPNYYDAQAAGWWCMGQCDAIGGWCAGGPWTLRFGVLMDARLVGRTGLDDVGVSRSMIDVTGGSKLRKSVPQTFASRTDFAKHWLCELSARLVNVRTTCGDWRRVTRPSFFSTKGVTAFFLDPPYAKGDMVYAGGGMGTTVAQDAQRWCLEHTAALNVRIALCGHKGEHAALTDAGWRCVPLSAPKGRATTERAKNNYRNEAMWLSPSCAPWQEFKDLLDPD